MKVIVTQDAITNFENIIDYLLLHVGISIADRISIEIWEGIDFISQNPYSGQSEPYLAYYNLSHRRWIVGNYKIVYKLERDVLIVTDIFDTRQNPNKILP